MPRIVVVGASCSGKTTLARQIATDLGIPHVELDVLYWGPGWTPNPIEQFRMEVKAEVVKDEWVVDGNYSKVRDVIWPRATHLIWLNPPFANVLWRLISRTFRRVITREELFSGNRESLRLFLFDRESLLWWMVRTHRRRNREYRRLMQDGHYRHLRLFEVRKPGDFQSMLLKRSHEGV